MAILSQQDLQSVIEQSQGPSQGPCVSLFLPTHRAGHDIQQGPIRLKNLVRQAEAQLIEEGTRPTEARELLAPIADLIDNAGFWRHQLDGLGIFRSRDVFRLYRLPLPLEEFVTVSDRFTIKPLLPLLINEARFYVLAISQKAVRLLDCSRDHMQRVELPHVPQGMEEALPEEPAPQLQRYTLPLGGPHATRIPGHGVGMEDLDVINLTRYFHRVEEGLWPILKDERAPLILACVEYLAPIFREVSRYRSILEPVVAGNPDGLADEELHAKAWCIAEPHFRQARDQAAAEYHEGLAKGRAGDSLKEVLTAAFQGRIATLFVPLGLHRWGRFTFEELALEEHADEQPGDDELLDLAAMQTLVHAGTVYGVATEDIPGGGLLAAVYRY